MSARFYAPGLGTFTGLDTYGGEVANPASLNRYLYAQANPATLIDPTGHRAEGCAGQDCSAIILANQRRARQRQSSPTTSTTNGGSNTPASASTGAPHVNSSTGTPQSPTPGVTPVVVPEGTLRAQLKGQCQGSGLANAGYCSYYDWAPGLDGPAGDATPNLLVPLVLFGGPVAGAAAATCIAACSTAAIVSGLGLGGAAEPGVQQTIQNAASGPGQTLAQGATNAAITTLPTPAQAMEMIRAATPVGSALKDDAMHRASAFLIDAVGKAGQVFQVTGKDGVTRILVQVNYAGGRAEWMLEDTLLTHARVVVGGVISGVPNK